MSDLIQLWNSTQDLYERFDLDAPTSVLRRKFMEEVLELIEASAVYENYPDAGDYTELKHEAVDVFVTVLGLLQGHRVELDEVLYAISKVIAKNNAKTHETHHIVDGLITRRKS